MPVLPVARPNLPSAVASEDKEKTAAGTSQRDFFFGLFDTCSVLLWYCLALNLPVKHAFETAHFTSPLAKSFCFQRLGATSRWLSNSAPSLRDLHLLKAQKG
jgi:hypothetical protein